jgi:hypothetical protein
MFEGADFQFQTPANLLEMVATALPFIKGFLRKLVAHPIGYLKL